MTNLHLYKLLPRVKWITWRWVDKILARRGIAAITLGHVVFVHSRFCGDANLYLHELVHVHQVRSLGGLRRFLSLYIILFIRQFVKTWSWNAAYQNHPYEVEAYAYTYEPNWHSNFEQWRTTL